MAVWFANLHVRENDKMLHELNFFFVELLSWRTTWTQTELLHQSMIGPPLASHPVTHSQCAEAVQKPCPISLFSGDARCKYDVKIMPEAIQWNARLLWCLRVMCAPTYETFHDRSLWLADKRDKRHKLSRICNRVQNNLCNGITLISPIFNNLTHFTWRRNFAAR